MLKKVTGLGRSCYSWFLFDRISSIR